MDRRGQAITLEAIVGGLILLSSVVFALQMTAVTPLSASTSSQHIETQLEASAEGVLAASQEDGSLKRAILYYNTTGSEFYQSGEEAYYRGRPPNITFGQRTEWAFDERGIAYNIKIHTATNGTKRLFDRGEPSDNAVTASTTVILMDDDVLYENATDNGEADRTSTKLGDTSGFYMVDQSPGGLYNVVRVEVIVWRI